MWKTRSEGYKSFREGSHITSQANDVQLRLGGKGKAKMRLQGSLELRMQGMLVFCYALKLFLFPFSKTL